MIKKILFVLTTLVCVFSSVGISLALEKGNKRKGKYTYRKVYKACNARGETFEDHDRGSPLSLRK